MTFSELGLNPEVLRAVDEAGYQIPTPIQEQAIPLVLQGRDILGLAQTGTGKTASFTLPMIHLLAKGRAKARMPRSLILEPTRELASQVADNFAIYGKYHKLSMALLIGGVSFGEQDKLIDRGVDVLIATPGRLLDHFERGKLMLHGVQILVVDESDRMLDMGFIPDVERICSLLPPRRQTLFFSATMPTEIKRLVDNFLTDPVQVAVAPPASPAATVEQALAIVDHKEKREALRSLLRTEDVGNAIVFCNTKRGVGTLERSLVRHGFNAGALHGDMDQHSRIQMLDSFRKGEVTILVASDVAARGLDIPKVSHVFNFDVPNHAEDYVHRIGRTGRAGRSGKSITLAAPEEARNWDAIAKLLGRDIDRIQIEGIENLDWSAEGRSRRRGGGRDRETSRDTGRRKSADRTERARPAEADDHQERTQRVRPAEAVEQERTQRKPERKREPAAERERTREPAAERRPYAAAPDRQADKRERGRHRPQREDAPVVGLGDHVPAFLLRPVPNLRRPDGEEEPKRAAG